MNINITVSTSIRVRYSETDQMGYVYYGNYSQYFEVGRVEAMRKIGIAYKTLEEMGYMLPVMNLKIDYLSPAKYDDELIIDTEIVLLKGARLVFYYIIYKEEQIICKGETALVFVNKSTMRPIQPPRQFIELLQKNL